jgi:hypothetical protein
MQDVVDSIDNPIKVVTCDGNGTKVDFIDPTDGVYMIKGDWGEIITVTIDSSGFGGLGIEYKV